VTRPSATGVPQDRSASCAGTLDHEVGDSQRGPQGRVVYVELGIVGGERGGLNPEARGRLYDQESFDRARLLQGLCGASYVPGARISRKPWPNAGMNIWRHQASDPGDVGASLIRGSSSFSYNSPRKSEMPMGTRFYNSIVPTLINWVFGISCG
jgi:hypothetical protein